MSRLTDTLLIRELDSNEKKRQQGMMEDAWFRQQANQSNRAIEDVKNKQFLRQVRLAEEMGKTARLLGKSMPKMENPALAEAAFQGANSGEALLAQRQAALSLEMNKKNADYNRAIDSAKVTAGGAMDRAKLTEKGKGTRAQADHLVKLHEGQKDRETRERIARLGRKLQQDLHVLGTKNTNREMLLKSLHQAGMMAKDPGWGRMGGALAQAVGRAMQVIGRTENEADIRQALDTLGKEWGMAANGTLTLAPMAAGAGGVGGVRASQSQSVSAPQGPPPPPMTPAEAQAYIDAVINSSAYKPSGM